MIVQVDLVFDHLKWVFTDYILDWQNPQNEYD